MKLFLYLAFFIIAVSCTQENQKVAIENRSETQIELLDSIISEKIYPATCEVKKNELIVRMKIPQREFYSASKLKLIRYLTIYEIRSYLDSIDKIYFYQIPVDTLIKFKTEQKYIATANNFNDIKMLFADKIDYDFAKYILKEINGYDLWNYYGVIDGIYKVNNRKENPMDLIQLSYELGKEYKLLKCDGINRKLFIGIKEECEYLKKSGNMNSDCSKLDFFINYNNCGDIKR